MLISNFGLFSGYVAGCIVYSLWRGLYSLGRFLRGIQPGLLALAHLGAIVRGLAVGLVLGVRLMIQHRRDPVRHDPDAREIAHALSGSVKT